MATKRKVGRPRKPDLDTMQGRYFVNKQKGMKKGEAALAAGYADVFHTNQIENSKQYQAIEKYYSKSLEERIGKDEVALEHAKIIRQDDNLNAKLGAIKEYHEVLEPRGTKSDEDNEQILVVLKKG